MELPIPPPVRRLYACGPGDLCSLLRREAEGRGVPDLRCFTSAEMLRETMAQGLPEAALIFLPDPEGLALAHELRRAYPELRVCCCTALERLLTDCPLSYQYLPLPPPFDRAAMDQALCWLGYPGRTVPEAVHVMVCGSDAGELSQLAASVPGVSVTCWAEALDALRAIHRGHPCDLLLVQCEAGDGLPPIPDAVPRAGCTLLLADKRPRQPTVYTILSTLKQLRREKSQEEETLLPKEDNV